MCHRIFVDYTYFSLYSTKYAMCAACLVHTLFFLNKKRITTFQATINHLDGSQGTANTFSQEHFTNQEIKYEKLKQKHILLLHF